MSNVAEYKKITGEAKEYTLQKNLSTSSWEESHLVEDPSNGNLYVITMLRRDKLLSWMYDDVDGELSRTEAERNALEKFKKFDENFKERIERLIGLVQHPNIVKYYSVEFDNYRGHYFALAEHVPGRPIFEETRGMIPEYMVSLAVQILKGLDYLHANRILHLKVKPSNINVFRSNRSLTAKFINAGYVASMDNIKESKNIGPLAYVAPEVVLGGSVDERADLFMFAVLVYYIFSGHLPFPKRHLKDTDLKRLAEIVKREELPPKIPDVSEKFNSIIMKLLDKDPNKRGYKRAADVIDDILQVYPDAGLDLNKSKLYFSVDSAVSEVQPDEDSDSDIDDMLEDEQAICIDDINDLLDE